MQSFGYTYVDLLLTSVVFIFVSLAFLATRKRRPQLPPGPRGLPIVGNWFQLPEEKHWEVYSRWAGEYGDIIYLKDFQREIIVLNSFKSAYELLEKRSNIYSSRPQFVMFHELMDFGGSTAFQPYGNTWRKHRTLYNQQMHKGAITQFESLQYASVRQLLKRLSKSPGRFREHIRRMAATIVLDFAYGHELQEDNDSLLNILQSNVDVFAKAIKPGAFLVDNFPILKFIPDWFPGADFKKLAAKTRAGLHRSRDIPFRTVKEGLKAGNVRPSFVANSLSDLGNDDEANEDVDAVKRVAAGILGAGTDTTSSTLAAFVLAMAVHPEYSLKAQIELDMVIGQSRLPEFKDRPALPYIDAILKEVLRWFPVVPTALPHCTIAEDVYEGYRIPKGSMIIPNTWKILHDPEMYSDPYTFFPDRFISQQGRTPERDPTLTGNFGFGRRICAGKNLAESTLWLSIATLLSVFKFANPLDEHGKPLDSIRALQPVGGSLCQPRRYTVDITPRSKEAEVLLEQLISSP